MMNLPVDTSLHLVCLAAVLCTLTISVTAGSCPGECSISTVENRTVANCSSLGLDCLPSSLSTSVLVLDLSKNPIFNFTDNIFSESSLTQLEEIYLSDHTVDDIQTNAFASLKNLLVVDLSHNRLKTVHPDIFADNSNIKKVSFRNNVLLKLPDTGSFLNAPSIQDLDLGFCNVRGLQPQLFSHLSDITHLNLGGNALGTIQKTHFSLLTKLQYLDLSSNLLQKFDNTIFSVHRELKTLIFRNNIQMNYSLVQEDEEHLWYEPPRSMSRGTIINPSNDTVFLKSDSLEVLDISGCFSHKLPTYSFLCGTPNLRILNLSHNSLIRVEGGHFSCLKELEEVYLTSSNLFTLYPDTFKNNSKLSKLLINQNRWSSMKYDSTILYDISSLKYIDISTDWLNRMRSNVFSKLQNLTFLNMSSNNLASNNLEPFNSDMFTHLKDIEVIDISLCKISRIPEDAFQDNDKLTELYLRYNPLGNSTLRLNIPTLKVLDLRSCSFMEISANSFTGLQKLTKLYLGGNSLIEFKKDSLKHLENLEYLDLSYCELMHIDPDSFSKNPKLTYLSLQGNALHALHQGISIINSPTITTLDLSMCNIPHLLPDTFANVTNLEALHLNNNELSSLNVSVMSKLAKLSELQLFGNPWRCDCALKDLRYWTLSRKIKQRRLTICESPPDMIGWSWAEAGDETCDPSLPKNCKEGGVDLPSDYLTTATQGSQPLATGSSVQNKDMKPSTQPVDKITSKPSSPKPNIIISSATASPKKTTTSTVDKSKPKLKDVMDIIGNNRDQSSSTYSSLIGRGIAAGFFAFVCIAVVGFALYSFVSRRYFPSRPNSLDYDRTLQIEETY